MYGRLALFQNRAGSRKKTTTHTHTQSARNVHTHTSVFRCCGPQTTVPAAAAGDDVLTSWRDVTQLFTIHLYHVSLQNVRWVSSIN